MSAGLALVSEGVALGNISLSARTPLIDGQIVEGIFVEPSKMNLTSTLPAKITGNIEFDLTQPKRFSLKGNLPVSVGAEVFTPASRIEILAIEDIIILVDILACPWGIKAFFNSSKYFGPYCYYSCCSSKAFFIKYSGKDFLSFILFILFKLCLISEYYN